VVTRIDRKELLRLIEKGAQIVDVLPQDEYLASHIPGAVSIPLKTLNIATTSQLNRAKPVVVY
jgi:rhodanese-related sulfurtransferase